MTPEELDRERRAFAQLQWVPYSLPSQFSLELASKGYYSRLQRQRSNQALDDHDKALKSQERGLKPKRPDVFNAYKKRRLLEQ